MAKYDITFIMLKYLDRHISLQILDFLDERLLYNRRDILLGKLQLVSTTKMVDYNAEKHKDVYGWADDKGTKQKRDQVLKEIHDLKRECQPLLGILNEGHKYSPDRLERQIDYEFQDREDLKRRNLEKLYVLSKTTFEIGQYQDAADYLYHYRNLTPNEEMAFWALWGKLAAEILVDADPERAYDDLTILRDFIASRYDEKDPVQLLQQFTWLIHWSLFIFCSDKKKDREKLFIDFVVSKKKMLSTIQANCPHILRYVAVAIVYLKRTFDLNESPEQDKLNARVMSDVIEAIRLNRDTYSDPITEFLANLYIDFNFEEAQANLEKCQTEILVVRFKNHKDEEWGCEMDLQKDRPESWKITKLHPRGQARALGLQVGDKIYKVDGCRIDDSETELRIRKKLESCQQCKIVFERPQVIENDFFLHMGRFHDTFIENARLLIFESFAKVHHRISFDDLAKILNIKDNIEANILQLLRDTSVDARIDSEKQQIVMKPRLSSVYKTVSEKIKTLSRQTQNLTEHVQKKYEDMAKRDSED